MHVFILLLILFTAASMFGLLEFYLHQKRIYSIPIRIHINGTRGKSSVTRLIGAGLNAGGIRAVTKVTGTYPRLILEDGTETLVYRKSNANIIEQLSIVKFAAERKADAIVIECMALEPQYQSITEEKMIHATIGVITNVRLDHVDVMGHTIPEIAEVLGKTIPPKAVLFTAEDRNTHLLEQIAARKKTSIVNSSPNNITDFEMEGFSYIEHKENASLALAVCLHLGVDRHRALQGMYKANPDAGALNKIEIESSGKHVTFYNAFAANDPQSTLMIWRKLLSENKIKGLRILLLNTRQDRLDRARQLSEMAGKEIGSETDYLILIGQSTEVVEHMCISYGVERTKIVNLGWCNADVVYDSLINLTEDVSSVVAIGNIGGMGGVLINYLESRSLVYG